MDAAGRRETWTLRLAVLAMGGLIFLACLVLVLMPLASLWLLSHLDFAYTEIYLLAFIACPVAIIGWGLVLMHLNRLYLGLAGPTARPLLDVSITAAVLIAVAALLISAIFEDLSGGAPLGP